MILKRDRKNPPNETIPILAKYFQNIPLKNITLLRISFDESTNDCKHDWHEGWNSRRGWSYRIDGGCYLRFRQRERLRQLLPLRADDVVIFLERVLQLQQLTGAEGRPYSLRLPEWLEEKARYVGTWNTQRQETHMNYSMSLPGYEMKLFPWFMLARANERNCRVGITLVLNLKKNVSSRWYRHRFDIADNREFIFPPSKHIYILHIFYSVARISSYSNILPLWWFFGRDEKIKRCDRIKFHHRQMIYENEVFRYFPFDVKVRNLCKYWNSKKIWKNIPSTSLNLKLKYKKRKGKKEATEKLGKNLPSNNSTAPSRKPYIIH